jgi:transcriptional regulator with XRE-family HTH domain
MARQRKTSTISGLFAEQLAAVRQRKRWSQQELAERLTQMGHPTDRTTIARTETGKRGISLEDAVLYAAALGVPLVALMTPRDDRQVQLTPRHRVLGDTFRAWVLGEQMLSGDDDLRFFHTEALSDAEWRAQEWRPGVQHIVNEASTLRRAAAERDETNYENALRRLGAEAVRLLDLLPEGDEA